MRTLDIKECADFLKVDRTTALKLAGTGVLPGARIGRAWVFLEDELVEYLRGATRRQMCERQAKAAETAKAKAASGSMATLIAAPPTKRGRKKRPRPDLSGYDLDELRRLRDAKHD